MQRRAFRLLLIALTPSNAPKCRRSKRGTHRPLGWRHRTHPPRPPPPPPLVLAAQKWQINMVPMSTELGQKRSLRATHTTTNTHVSERMGG